ncbi:MAG: hypothetical protein AAF656_12930 [Planctomycetota bacterium]
MTRLPQEKRPPSPGETAEIVVVDLQEGTERVVAETAGWEPQLGAQINWGGDDHTLFFADCDTTDWTPHAVRLDPINGDRQRIDGPLYHASPDGKLICGTEPRAMPRTQWGYGVALPHDTVPLHNGAPDDTGLFITDVATNTRKLVVSLADVVEKFAEPMQLTRPDDFRIYGFHSKFSPDGSRLIWTMRWYPARFDATHFDMIASGHLRFAVLTCNIDGSDLYLAVGPDQWAKGGHHINWFPDNQTLSMNLRFDDEHLTLMQVDRTGADLRPITIVNNGSGHPTVHPDGRHILADTYAGERWTDAAGTTPLRWIDRTDDSEFEAVRIPSRTPEQATQGQLRLDPHPAWDRTWRWVAFNAFPGTRRVYLADFKELIATHAR